MKAGGDCQKTRQVNREVIELAGRRSWHEDACGGNRQRFRKPIFLGWAGRWKTCVLRSARYQRFDVNRPRTLPPIGVQLLDADPHLRGSLFQAGSEFRRKTPVHGTPPKGALRVEPVELIEF
jgi:hypothetical protein